MPHWIRVRDTRTKHEFDVEARAFRPAVMEKVNDPERWPDLKGPRALPRPAKPFVGKDGRHPTATAGPADTGAADDEQVPTTTDTTASRRRASRSTPADEPADTNTSSKE